MSPKGTRPSLRDAREQMQRGGVGVDELARRAAAGLDLWTGGTLSGERPTRAGRPWAAEEDELVRALTPEEAAARTGRTLPAVKARRRALGVG